MELEGELQLRNRPFEAVDILINGEDLDSHIEDGLQSVGSSRDDSWYEVTSYGSVRISIEQSPHITDTFTKGQIVEALSEARAECYREASTSLWRSFWDRLTEGGEIPEDPKDPDT